MFFSGKIIVIQISFALIFLFPAVILAYKQTEAEIKKKQIEQIETDLIREKEKFIRFDIKEKDILEQLSLIEKEIEGKKEVLERIEDRIVDRTKELEINRKKLDEIDSSLKHLEISLSERLIVFYKNAKRGYMKVLLSTDDLDALNHYMKYLRIILDRDINMMRELDNKKTDYNRHFSVIEEQLEAIAHLEETENKNLTELKEALEKEVLLLVRIHDEKEFYEVAVKELQSAADFLKETILNLEASTKKGKASLPGGFGNSKGKLLYPLKGRIIKNTEKIGQRSFDKKKGIYIKGPLGSAVKAIYSGRVDYSGVLKGYGQVIIINHGERYFTIYAHLGERKKSEGETVLPGDVIGYVGEAGLTIDSALYFEIRKGEENLNPLKWLKVN